MLFRDRKAREIVEQHLNQINILLANAKRNNLTDAINNYTSQKLALEYVLRDFKRLGL